MRHPSMIYLVLKERKLECIPIIESDNFDDLNTLFDEDCSRDVRNQYASKALLLFLPFRELKEIYCTEGFENSSWTKFMELRGRLDSGLWKPGIDILQNHQDRVYNIQRLSKIEDPSVGRLFSTVRITQITLAMKIMNYMIIIRQLLQMELIT